MPDLAAELARLHAAAFVMPRPWSKAEIADLLAGPLCFLVQEPVGFLIGRVVAGEAELLTVAVWPAAQGRGIGGRLVQGFLAEARAREAVMAFLEVAETNHAARAVYAKAGFDQTGRRRGYYHTAAGAAVDALVLERKL
jgi:ribosomal-protein-alanine N-acetyltransferase